MIVTQLTVTEVGGIKLLTIPIHPRMNIISGPNGIGKTTILECVAHLFFHGDSPLLKRNVQAISGSVSAKLANAPNDLKEAAISVGSFSPAEKHTISGQHQLSPYIFSLKTTRTFSYQGLSAVSKDVEKPIHVTYNEAGSGIPLQDTKNWFVNRYLYSAHPGALLRNQLQNFETAKKCFSVLNPDFVFSRVNASANEIMITTPTGELYYEYLSSGFKSCIAILFGIIKEIEYRFLDAAVDNFECIVLIDELELHLHPAWQARITNLLLEIFPKIQFITTTHSPHVIQNADPAMIIALTMDDGRVVRRELPHSEFGFKGWTVEEVLEDVMGMTDTRTELFNNIMRSFGAAIDAERRSEAEVLYRSLDNILHPLSPMRKIARIQLSAMGGSID